MLIIKYSQVLYMKKLLGLTWLEKYILVSVIEKCQRIIQMYYQQLIDLMDVQKENLAKAYRNKSINLKLKHPHLDGNIPLHKRK